MTCCPKDRGLLLFCSSLESNFEIPRISKQKRTSKKKKKKTQMLSRERPPIPYFLQSVSDRCGTSAMYSRLLYTGFRYT